MSKFTYYILLLLFVFIGKYESRSIQHDDNNYHSSPLLIRQLKRIDSPEPVTTNTSTTEKCEHMYGFLPCTENLLGHLFLIIIYEYLLFLGEKYITQGSELVFQILGPGIFGASAFEILGALPEAMILLVSGLSKSKETAQEKVFTGVGLLAGSTVLLLTLVWGTCVIVGRIDFSSDDSLPKNRKKSSWTLGFFTKLRSLFTGYGIRVDQETKYTARIMVLSVLPFLIVQVPEFILKYLPHFVIFISLAVSIGFLLVYFVYQIFQPWIQKRRLEYMKVEHLMANFLNHVQSQATGKLLTDHGTPNLPLIQRLFSKIDLDDDENLTPEQFRKLIMETTKTGDNLDKNAIIEEVIEEFDLDCDHLISRDEFVKGFAKWLVKTKKTAKKQQRSYSKKFLDNLYQEKMQEYARSKYLIEGILRHFQTNAMENLLTEEGTPDIPSIIRLFDKCDIDGDNHISHSELKELVEGIKFGKIDLDMDSAVDELMEELDTNGDHLINKEEFVNGITKFIDSRLSVNKNSNEKEEIIKERGIETDNVIEEGNSSRSKGKFMGKITSKLSACKAGFLLIVGITIISLLAEPLIEVVRDFSHAAHLPSFFVSFVLLPLATNSRRAVSAIVSARRKKSHTTSLTFSEIYGWVFMNNVLGLTALLGLVCARDLEWDFSAEVLVILIICGVMGLLSSFSCRFPLWTSALAYLLYPSSLLMVYFLNSVFRWH